MPGLLLLRIHTDEGIVGCGETYYAPEAVAALVHDWMHHYLLGKDPLEIEKHWRFLYERTTNFGSRGAELRAISAIDLALWDIFGQATNLPVWQLLGGCVQESIKTYNSCGGPSYGAKTDAQASHIWPGHGPIGNPGPLNDYWSIIHRPVELAEELREAGYGALKTWSLDFAAHKPNGPIYVSDADVERGLEPFRAIREALGNSIELILDGHGFFQLPVALRIAAKLRQYDILWAEDLIRVDSIDTVADFRQKAGIPVAVSEMFSGPDDFRLTLEKRAADYVMIDPTWVGGITQTKNLTRLAQLYNVPVVMHDCTGPLTLLSGVQVAAASGNVAWQESVRAHIGMLYPKLIDTEVSIVQGMIPIPRRAGIGAAWLPELFQGEAGKYRATAL
ncbi:mandelate racemase/muconate lactonizing enzyme family protein [Blastopirellula sp. JC732]|uniref:Mandelate racemase/muconate lactonizing enzyme family protein n=1 Tax=Blastopirellula sediminis TaxID=2894196 RepID=A0A9X1MHG3_9BACT|nr:mandelate racemase/muconate lactonizing enzyme family protein [Blastopirellula sediminis]MCC9608034.1 mandelate racemase/muconate lactonizing enzyme family protein [Blastopirellula sediminis]MCC9627173.1 mandelate racemase/muconate lactonizing enzyme family protein [Blastopirellula sediminis]